MNIGTFCSGIGSPELAATRLGWRAAWCSEIEKFPSAVLETRFPETPNLGDMTKLHGGNLEPVDVVFAGTPCQSFSVAGLRQGMADPRGNLALVYLRLVSELRPRWLVWENVPGVLSSHGGRDFGAFLGALGELGYGWAYRVLDAQFVRVESHPHAVPQRRRRVFVVGHLGDWRRAAAVLFERESVRGNPPPRRAAGQAVAAPITSSFAKHGGAHCGGGQGHNSNYVPVAHTLRAEGCDASEDGTGRGTPLVPAGTAVRRLTPTECERLQGFPDGWTDITFNGKPAKDTPRYKAIGNSIAVNCSSWILQRIQAVEDATK